MVLNFEVLIVILCLPFFSVLLFAVIFAYCFASMMNKFIHHNVMNMIT